KTFTYDVLKWRLYDYETEAAYSDTIVKAAAKDNTTEELLLNLGAAANSTMALQLSQIKLKRR
ncbi:MAG TPA: hypothetical protein DCZ10_12460, partial [Pelotomaculum sp.]|nr:hypothetical protein [Pelotomaculum sp.]